MTTDALITQKHIAWTVRESNAHYLHLLALKDDHPTLFEDVQNFFDYADKVGLDLHNRIPTNGEVVVLELDGSVVGLMHASRCTVNYSAVSGPDRDRRGAPRQGVLEADACFS